MGEVKIQLAEEALVDAAAAQVSQLKLSPQYLHPCRGQSRSGATSCTSPAPQGCLWSTSF